LSFKIKQLKLTYFLQLPYKILNQITNIKHIINSMLSDASEERNILKYVYNENAKRLYNVGTSFKSIFQLEKNK
jgi:hypothetical protein